MAVKGEDRPLFTHCEALRGGRAKSKKREGRGGEERRGEGSTFCSHIALHGDSGQVH